MTTGPDTQNEIQKYYKNTKKTLFISDQKNNG